MSNFVLLFKIIFIVLSPLHFHMNFRIRLSVFLKMPLFFLILFLFLWIELFSKFHCLWHKQRIKWSMPVLAQYYIYFIDIAFFTNWKTVVTASSKFTDTIFSKSICWFHVSVSYFGNSFNISVFHYFISYGNMPANLENSAVATGLEKVSCFHSNPKPQTTFLYSIYI